MAELPATISATLANNQEGAPLLEDGRPAGQPALDEGGRYTDQRLIGVGGMGEVRLVYDGVLKRTAVLKTVRSELAPEVWDRLIAEAGLTAGLQHPGVVPVYDAGRLTDGRPFYVMREVRGFTLAELIEAVHKVSVEAGRWSNTRDGWTLRGLIGVVASVAATISYAHRQGWVHRDIKPANIMVEGPGAVVVVDWGIAKRAAFAALGDGSSGEGVVTGSPGFMSPEQLRGMPPWPSFDVFALGATLQAVLVGGTPNPSRSPPFPVADALQAVASAAMAPDPAVRTPSAERVASALRAWLDGVQRRDQAMARVEEADRALFEVAGWRSQAAAFEAEAVALGAGVALWESVDKKLPMWRAEDAAERLRAAIAGAEERAAQLLHAALSVDPELDVAHERLADLHRVQHEAAERRGDGLGAARAEAALRAHNRGQHSAYLEGRSRLALRVEPADARLLLHRVERSEERRLVARPIALLEAREGRVEQELAHGSFLIEASHPDCATVRLPLVLRRGEEGPAPFDEGLYVLPLPSREGMGPDDCLVPPGWCTVGDDPNALDPVAPGRWWIEPFILRRHPVTVAEYIDFLNALLDQGRADEAALRLPRAPVLQSSDDRALTIVLRDGRYAPMRPLDLRRPAGLLSYVDAQAYVDWIAAHSGCPWRMPHELEWEWAARGADGRAYPWGHRYEASFAATIDGLRGPPCDEPVDLRPLDESPFGIRGLGGNSRDWCCNRYVRGGEALRDDRVLRVEPLRAEALQSDDLMVVRGGNYISRGSMCRAATRFASRPEMRYHGVGLRLARSV